MKRFISLILSIAMILNIITGFETKVSAASVTIEVGDYITLGTYYGEPIVWRCVGIDENGPLMLSDKILCLKAFDAKGESTEYHSDGWGYIRNNQGSNCWSDSSLRQWLNCSGTTVEYTHCPPNSDNVYKGYNAYDEEAGFLNGFTQSQLSAIKTVTQRSYVNSWETTRDGYCDGGSKELIYYINTSDDYNVYYYQNVQDDIFLLNPEQIDMACENLGISYVLEGYPTQQAVDNSDYENELFSEDSPWEFWLGVPRNEGASYQNQTLSGLGYGGTWYASSYTGTYGVRPAFYLNVDAYSGSYYDSEPTSSYVWLASESTTFTVFSQYANALNNVNFAYGSLSSSSSTGEKSFISIGHNALAQNDITVSKDGYRDYIIPCEVGASFKSAGTKNFNIYLSADTNDSKPYVSTVFALNNGESTSSAYSEVQKTTFYVSEGSRQNVIISADLAGADSATYYLSADDSHRISNSTGVFTAVDLYSVFELNTTVYAYVITSNGEVSDPVALKFEMKTVDSGTLDFLDNSTIDIIGTSGQGVTIGDSVPLIGGSSLNLDLVEFPMGVSYDTANGTVKLSFGVDIFESKSSMSSTTDRENTWMNFKSGVKSLTKAVESSTEKLKKYNNLVSSMSAFGGMAKPYSAKSNSFTAGFMGYAEGKIVDGRIVFTEVCGTVPIAFSFKYTQQGVVWVVPAYFYVEAGAEVSLEIGSARQLADSNVPLDFDITLNMEPFLKLGGGLGVKGAVSAGIWGSGSLPALIEFADSHFKLGLKGECGVEAEFFMFKGNLTVFSGEINVIDKYWGKTKAYAFNRSQSDTSGETEISLASRDYAEDTSEWYGGNLNISTASLEKVSQNVTTGILQESVYSNAQTQMIQFDDKLMMVYVEDDTSRDTYNRYRIMYSIYENDVWSEPKAIADSGCMDAAPSLATDGENVYVAWQNISEKITDDSIESANKLLTASEICIAKYDIQTDEFTDVKTVTDNDIYDYSPSLSVVNGAVSLYWASLGDNDFTGSSVSIMKYTDDKVTEVASNLCYVTEIASNDDNYSYIADTDGDISTTDDLMIFENGDEADASSQSCSNAIYGTIDGENCLFYTNSDNICYILNGEVNKVFSDYNGAVCELTCVNGDDTTTLVWTQITDNGGSEIYFCKYSNGEWSEPIQLTDGEDLISSMSAVDFDNQIYTVFSSTERVQTENSDGDTEYENGKSNLCFARVENFTNLAVSVEYIDETEFVKGSDASFTAFLENKGTQDIKTVEIAVSDELGNSYVYQKDINLKSGAQETVTVKYNVPEDFEQTVITVNALCDGDVDESDNSVDYEVGISNVSVGEVKYDELDEVFVVSSVVENNTLVDAENIVIEVIGGDDETVIGTIDVESISAGEKYVVEYVVDKSTVVLNDDGIYAMKFVAKSADTNTDDESDYSVVAITPYNPTLPTYTITVDSEVVATIEEGSEYTFGDAAFGYYDGTNMYRAGSIITVTENIEVTSINILSVEMAVGAGIKLDTESTSGIRFQATVTSDNEEAIDDANVITTGMLITVNDIYEELGNSKLTLNSNYSLKNIINSGWYNDTIGSYCSSIVNITESNYVRDFIARAYVTVNYEDGTSKTVYSDMSSKRSIQYIATCVKNDTSAYGSLAADQQALVDVYAASK